jgi:hypothetical protein
MEPQDDDVDTGDKDEGSHRIPGDPSRDGGPREAPGAEPGGKRGSPRKDERERPEEAPQPGGGRHSESEKPSSPDSRWGGGRNA